jgi:hypothetical protein
MLLKMGLSGTPSLCIFGRPYSRGALEPEGCNRLRRSSGSEDFFSSFMFFRSMEPVESFPVSFKQSPSGGRLSLVCSPLC